jgi:hypothetical protein
MRRGLALRPSSESLEPVVLLSSASSLAAAAETGNIDAMKRPDAKPINLAPWASLATEVFQRANTDLPLISGGGFSAADKKATLKAVETGMHNANVPKVASGSLVLAGVNNFDDGAGTLMFKLTVKKKIYAVQLERTPSGPTTVYVGQTDPTVLVAVPPTTPVTGQRVASSLQTLLQNNNLSMGSVSSTAVGTAVADQLIAMGFPAAAWNVFFSWEGAAIGNNGGSLTFATGVMPDEETGVTQDFWAVALLNSDGTFEVSVFPQDQEENLYSVSNPIYAPFTAANAGVFYSP